jgi:PAS domain S-box-containing protein
MKASAVVETLLRGALRQPLGTLNLARGELRGVARLRSAFNASSGRTGSPMTLEELVGALADANPTSVCLTEADLEQPGPKIRYVNPAFCAMTGFSAEELIGRSPRVLQGKRTNRLTLRRCSRALREGNCFRGYITNYRKSGEEYICEIDVRPVIDEDGAVRSFIAFEREVRRRRGRPSADPRLRYDPVDKRAVFPR